MPAQGKPNQGNRKYASLLYDLSSEAQQRLLKFLASPYCTGMPAENDCLRLVEFTLNLGSREKARETSDEAYLHALRPEGSSASHRFNHLASNTFKLMEDFLVAEMSGIDPRERAILLLRYYSDSNLEKRFWAEAENLQAWQADRMGWRWEDYLLHLTIEMAKSVSRSKQNEKKDDLGLLNTIVALDEFYLLARLYITTQLLNQGRLAKLRLSKADAELPINLGLPQFARTTSNPLFRLFYQSFALLSGGMDAENVNWEHFHEGFESGETEAYLDDFEKFICNYLVGQIDAGKNHYLVPLRHIQKRRVEGKRVLGSDGKILKGEFQSIVTVALKCGDLDWVSQFIESFGTRIGGTEFPEDCLHYNLANYHFYRRDFAESLNLLSEVQNNYKENQLRIPAKILEVKIFYETSDQRRLTPHLDALKTLFAREKKENAPKGTELDLHATEAKYEMGKNFVYMMQRLVRATEKPQQSQIEKSIKDLKATEWLADRAWLLEKLEEKLNQ